jgi:two-component system CheB/CheR fusion protein
MPPRKINQSNPTSQSNKKSINSNKTSQQELMFPVVGIGASAGGLAAFTELLQHLPPDTGMAFILVQHLAADHTSALSEILTRSTEMVVQEVENDMPIAPDHVYVIPPNTTMKLENSVLILEPRLPDRSKVMVIDTLFESIATECKNKAIAIVLSGSNADGTLGLAAIKEAGGISIAQDPLGCEFSIMPQSAISSGYVDFILPVADIASQLLEISKHPYLDLTSSEDLKTQENEQALLEIFALLKDAMGVDFSNYKRGTLLRRIMRRMALYNTNSLADYLLYVQENTSEVEILYHDILISVTRFFRDPGSFDALKTKVFPNILAAKLPDSTIRIWVTACSTGEEAYTIAMSLLEFLGDQGSLPNIQIFATDISEVAIAHARIGIYPVSIEANVSPERLRRFFVPVEGGYQIGKRVRELCVFARQDMISDPPFSQLDLITCRNVLIYMEPVLQKRVIPIFHYALKSTGFLMLGTSESIGEYSELFIVADKKFRIYTRKMGIPRLNVDFLPRSSQVESRFTPPHSGQVQWTDSDLEKAADKIVVQHYAPAGVIINQDLEVIHFRGQLGFFLEPTPGKATLNLLKIVRPQLALELRSAIHQAMQADAVGKGEISLQLGDQWRTIQINVIPFQAPTQASDPAATQQPERDPYFLVLFQDREIDLPSEGGILAHTPASERQASKESAEIARLSQELASNKEYLESIINSLEASNQNLKVANEEVLSSNEELQSTNEELETAKEEIQATNEELNTINEELRSRNVQLNQVNNDLTNLISSVNIPILILSGDLRIRRFTPLAEQLFNLIPGDMGRPFSHIQHNLQISNLDVITAQVIDSLNTFQKEVVDTNGRWYSLRIRPYKTTDNQIDGAVISLIDIDEMKRSLVLLEESRNYANAIVETVPIPLAVLNSDYKIITSNRAFQHTFMINRPIDEQKLFEVLPEGSNVIPLRKQLDRILTHQNTISNYEIAGVIPSLGQRTLMLNACHVDGLDSMVLLALEDITMRKQAEQVMADDYNQKLQQQIQELQRLNQLKDDFLSTISHELRTPLTNIRMAAQMLEVSLDNLDSRSGKLHPPHYYLNILKEECKREISLINDLLELAFLESEINSPTPSVQINFQSRISDIIEPFESRIQEHEQKLVLQLPPDLPPLISDLHLVKRILRELLHNACKYTPQGETIRLEFVALAPTKGDPSLQITVCNSGIEIPASELPHIFDKFYRIPSHDPWKQGGTGLGLALVKSMVTQLKGTIEASSGNGETCFQLTFPLGA